MYKTMKHGVSMQGQSAIFKLRFAEEMPNFEREIGRYTYWLDKWKTEYKGKTYYYYAGSFHLSNVINFGKSRLRAVALRDIEKSIKILEQCK
jgi:hypothetical protein